MESNKYSKEIINGSMKNISKCRKGGLQSLELIADNLFNYFNELYFYHKGFKIQSIAFDFLQGKNEL